MPQHLGSGTWTWVQMLVWQTLSCLHSPRTYISYRIERRPSFTALRMGATLAEEAFAQENWVTLPGPLRCPLASLQSWSLHSNKMP